MTNHHYRFDPLFQVYQTKKADVEDLAEPLFFRHDELTARPAAVAMARNRVRDIKLLVAKWVDSMPQVVKKNQNHRVQIWKEEQWSHDVLFYFISFFIFLFSSMLSDLAKR